VIEELIAEIAREGERRHAGWNREVYAKWAGRARLLARGREDEPEMSKVVRAYLEVVREAIAEQLLATTKSKRPRTLLELGLVRASGELGAHTPKRALELLASVWNLAEGLREEPAWMNDYVLSRQGELTSLEELPRWLKSVLEPVLEDSAASTFTRNFAVQVLDFRLTDPSFLPGEMLLLAPRVLAVRDRESQAEIGVLLRHEQKSEITGVLRRSAQPSTPAVEPESPPIIVTPTAVRVGATEVPLPLLVSPHAHHVVPAGFIAISAVDSQRLWIVESR
jgi:hypothetical protein